MAQKSPLLRRFGFICFTVAIFLEVMVTLVSAWPDMESVAYGFTRYTEEALPSLSCPVMMTSLDREMVTLRLRNPLEKAITRAVKMQFSARYEVITVDERVKLEPKETKTLSWEVGKENIDLKNLIVVRAFAYPASSLKMKEATCGTFVVNLPFTGGPVIYYSMLILAVLGLGFGFWIWVRNSVLSQAQDVSIYRRMRFIALIASIGMVASIFRWWALGLLALIVTTLTLMVFLVNRDK